MHSDYIRFEMLLLYIIKTILKSIVDNDHACNNTLHNAIDYTNYLV